MALFDFSTEQHVAVLTMDSDENRFNPLFLNTFLNTLDEIEQHTDATTLVVKSSHEKIFSNGIDLEWILPFIQKKDLATSKDFFYLLNRMFRRLVTYPLVTIAAITGHAFAGGAIMCCAFDFRFMRSDRGYFCFPEVDLGIPFLPGMNELLKKAMPMYMVEYMEYTGARLTAEECEQHNIIKKGCHMETLMEETMAFAGAINKKRPVIQEMKMRLNKHILHAIDVDDVAHIESGKFNIT